MAALFKISPQRLQTPPWSYCGPAGVTGSRCKYICFFSSNDPVIGGDKDGHEHRVDGSDPRGLICVCYHQIRLDPRSILLHPEHQ